MSDKESKILNYKQAAEYLGIPIGTLYAMVSKRQLPHLRFGNRFVRFKESDLIAWINEHKVPASNAYLDGSRCP